MSEQEQPSDEIQEEYFESAATGVEVEDERHLSEEVQPWDPERIRVHTLCLERLAKMVTHRISLARHPTADLLFQ